MALTTPCKDTRPETRFNNIYIYFIYNYYLRAPSPSSLPLSFFSSSVVLLVGFFFFFSLYFFYFLFFSFAFFHFFSFSFHFFFFLSSHPSSYFTFSHSFSQWRSPPHARIPGQRPDSIIYIYILYITIIFERHPHPLSLYLSF